MPLLLGVCTDPLSRGIEKWEVSLILSYSFYVSSGLGSVCFSEKAVPWYLRRKRPIFGVGYSFASRHRFLEVLLVLGLCSACFEGVTWGIGRFFCVVLVPITVGFCILVGSAVVSRVEFSSSGDFFGSFV